MKLTRLGVLRLCFLCLCFFMVLGAIGLPLSAQSLDSSANNLLHGTFYFRHVMYFLSGDIYGDLGQARSIYGNMTFNGDGTYSISATVWDSSAQVYQTLNGSSGTYGISPSGFGWISNPAVTGALIYGSVSNNIFVGSSTESGFNDMFVAAAIGSSPATAASFVGSYSVASIDFPDGSVGNTQDLFYQLNADGKGNLGTVSVSLACIGSGGCSSGTSIVESFPGVKYSASNGAIPITLIPGSQNQTCEPGYGYLSGGNVLPSNQYLYISPDGNFIFGGSPCGWDMFVGVRTGSSTAVPNLSGVYYQAGIDQNVDPATGTDGTLDTYYGSAAASQGSIWDHHREAYFNLSPFGMVQFDNTFNDGYTIPAGGVYDDPNVAFRYAVSADGALRIGFDRWPNIGINVAIQAPSFPSPGGPYIFPDGIVNTASGAPFTAPVARGEEVTLNGSDLARSSVGQSVIPHTTNLNGVQVLVNGVPAEIDYVSPSQIYFQIPWETTESLAVIQVVNQDGTSNSVTMFVSTDSPGVYTIPSGGLGYAAAQRTTDYSLLNPGNPVNIGDPVVIYVDGLGDVSAGVADGAASPPGSSNPTVNQFSMSVGGIPVPSLDYVGLTPGSVGLYQINFTIPAGVPSGDQIVNISSPDAVTSEALISIAASSASASMSAANASPLAIKKPSGRARPMFLPSSGAKGSSRNSIPH